MKPQGKGSKKDRQEVHIRKKYMDHSRRFINWMDSLGFEKTLLGRVANVLDQRFDVRKLSFIFIFCLFVAFIMFADFDFSYKFKAGDVSSTDIKSPISFQIVDEVATEAKRVEAESATLPVFDYDREAFEPVFNKVYSAFRKMREYVQNTTWPKSQAKTEVVIKNFLRHKSEFEEILGEKVSNRTFEWLTEKKFSVGVENVIIWTLSDWSSSYISDSPDKVVRANQELILLRTLEDGAGSEEKAAQKSNLKDIRKTSHFDLNGIRGVDRFSNKDKAFIFKLAHNLLAPNVTFNKKETSLRAKQARESVLPVQISIQKGQTIVNSGTKVQPIHLTILNEIQNRKSEHRTDFISLNTSFLLLILIVVFLSYLRRFSLKKIRIQKKDYMVMGTVTLFVVLLTKFFLFLTNTAFASRYGNLIPPSAFLYAAPVAAGPMLVGLLITYGEVVWLFTAFLATALAVMVDMNFGFYLMAMIGGIAGARGVFNCEKRNDIYFAGLRTGVVNAAIIAFLIAMTELGSGQILQEISWSVPAAFVGGILSSLVAMMLIPLLESVFNYTTDIKLLELSNLNHPLMKKMIVSAPGTYHHSLAVGTMVEEAAEVIGANPLLAKVMAYYHDIGKMEHAQYFVENQRPGYNPHDHITPYMSKTILIAHVKDGAELGLKHKLGEPIIDGILQHHGTTLISYFYNKAIAEQDEDIDNVEESDFRYPGPKPQFKEAALVMLADSIEAAARSIEEPTAARLTHLVKNIIQNKFIDGQLDECNLTLKDLSVIEAIFKKTLLSIHHQRIDYPHMKLGAPVKEIKTKKIHSISNE